MISWPSESVLATTSKTFLSLSLSRGVANEQQQIGISFIYKVYRNLYDSVSFHAFIYNLNTHGFIPNKEIVHLF